MLEALDYQSIDSVFRFFGVILDGFCGKADNTPITKDFTFYSDISFFVF